MATTQVALTPEKGLAVPGAAPASSVPAIHSLREARLIGGWSWSAHQAQVAGGAVGVDGDGAGALVLCTQGDLPGGHADGGVGRGQLGQVGPGPRTWCAPTRQPQPFDLHVCRNVNAASRLGCATIDVMAQSDNEPADDDDHDGSTATGRAITAAQTCVVS